ncbi:hypothetical protein ACH4YO_41240 [Streptomyces noursei]|uniref:hypothetical protein n=1 Tax=Streptomyces noursei TaxID=1971 RepID=UPI0033DB4641
MLPQIARSSCSTIRLPRIVVLAAAAAAITTAAPVAVAVPTYAPAAIRDAALVSTLHNESPIVPGESKLLLGDDIELNGQVSLKVDGGKLTHTAHKIIGGEIILGGKVMLNVGARSATIDNLRINIETGCVKAKINGKPLVLGSLDTSTLHLHKRSGEKLLHVGLGIDGDSVELSRPAATELNGILGIRADESDGLDAGDDLLGALDETPDAALDVGVKVGPVLAADLNMQEKELMDTALNTYTSPGLNLVSPFAIWRCPPRESLMREIHKGNRAEPQIGMARVTHETEKPFAQVTQGMDNPEAMLASHQEEAPQVGLASDERAKLRLLRKENHELKMERHILMQAVALWVKSATK